MPLIFIIHYFNWSWARFADNKFQKVKSFFLHGSVGLPSLFCCCLNPVFYNLMFSFDRITFLMAVDGLPSVDLSSSSKKLYWLNQNFIMSYSRLSFLVGNGFFFCLNLPITHFKRKLLPVPGWYSYSLYIHSKHNFYNEKINWTVNNGTWECLQMKYSAATTQECSQK